MSLQVGARLGSYEVLGPLGAGGMGEVYRATDLRLGREVAVKVLPEEFFEGEERRRRFEREAKLLATLNHPNIAAIYSFEESGGRLLLVMELLEGETLRGSLRAGPLAPRRAIDVAVQVANGLSAAHEKGIVHRDLKPENVFLTREDRVKILDFGLAKIAQPLPSGEELSTAGTLSNLTEAGAVFGTVSYMSPEQARGEPVDHRSDVFAFGTILYEMLSGTNPFRAATPAETLASILRHEPAPPEGSPAPLAAIAMRCLEKKREARFQSTADLAFALEALGSGSATSAPFRAAPAPAERPRLLSRGLLLSLAAALAGASVTFGVLKARTPKGASAPAVRFEVPPPEGGSFGWSAEGRSFAVSPDGSRIAWVASDARGARSLWLRPLESLESKSLAGTEGASSLFWSPDGASLGFFAGGKLKRMDLPAGAPVPIADVGGGGGKAGTWGAEDILFAGVQGDAIYRVPATGGTPAVVLKPDAARGETRVVWPAFLPDGRRFLYVSRRGNDGMLVLAAPGKPGREVTALVSDTAFVEPGALVFARDGALFTQGFDAAAGRLVGAPSALAGAVRYFMSTGAAGFAASRNGTLVYVSQEDVARLEWFDRAGNSGGPASAPGTYLQLRFSPDGRRLLFDRARKGPWTYDIWSLDVERNLETRVTSDVGSEFGPVWMPDGRRFIYSAVAGSNPRLFRMDLVSGANEDVVPGSGFQLASDVSPDGGALAYTERKDQTFELRIVTQPGPPTPIRFAGKAAGSGNARFSPDGRYVAYISNETGDAEAYVAPFPGPGERMRVSTAGASGLVWPRAAGEILFVQDDGRMMSVPVRTSPRLEIGRPSPLFTTKPGWKSFDATPDGKRFLAVVSQTDGNRRPATVVVPAAGPASKP